MTDKTELLPCPFCGATPKPFSFPMQGKWEATCDDEKCPAFPILVSVDEWNNRAAPAEDVRAVWDEPVAYVMPAQIEAMKSVGWMHAFRDKGKTGLEMALYRHPQRQVVLPDERTRRTSDIRDEAYDNGWNACLDEVERLNK